MALTKIRGNTQIKTGTITNVEIAANAGIELSKLAQGAELILRDGSVAFTGNIDLGSHQIKNVAAPTDSGDVAIKSYVDAADTTLQNNINSESSAREAADLVLQGNIDAEALARAAADEALQGNIDAEALARAAADLALDGRLTTAEGDIVSLEGRMDTAESDIQGLDTRVGSLENGLQAETSARQAADLALDGRLTTAEGDIVALDGRMDSAEGRIGVLESGLSAEVSRAISVEGVLRTDFNAEVAARQAADTTLQNNINSEASTRAAADTALDGRLVKAEENLAFPVDVLFENNASVYADARPGVVDPSSAIRDGWYFSNTSAGQKVNWYFFDGTANNVSFGDLSAYAVVTLDAVSPVSVLPFLVVYTALQASGNASAWFHASRVYNMPTSGIIAGKQYLIYVGANPNVHTDIPHIALTAGTTLGTFASGDRVSTVALNTNSAAAVNTVKFVAERLGVSSPSYKQEFELRVRHATQVALDAEAAARAAADTTLQNNINSEASARQAADTTLQNNINAEQSARIAGDQNLQSQIDNLSSNSGANYSALEARVTTAEGDINSLEARMTTAEGDINTLESGLAQEILDRQAGDSATLASANSYTDGKVADLVNSAPAVLDTLKELADALNDDPNFATTVANQIAAVQAEVDAEEIARAAADTTLQNNINAEQSARIAADSALDIRVSALELFKDAQTVYVAKNGNDSTGNGGEHAPFLTLQAALASISDASATKRYIIKMKAGSYTETGIVALKANVFVVGENRDAVRIGATSFSMHSSFSGSADNRSGFANVILLNSCDFNWATVTSAAGKLYFTDVSFSAAVSMNGHNNAIAQAQFHNCIFFSTFTVSGINVGVHRNNIHYGNITLNQHPNGGMATILAADGGTCSGTVTLSASVNDFSRRCSMFARSFYMEYLTVNGPSAYCDLTDNSVPRDIARLSKLNGGNVVYINTLSPVDSNSRNIGEPGKQYLYNFNYVNASTGTDLYVISMGESYSADSSGKSIFIESDSYGLNADVSGGDIHLTTAAVSGSGVRGKIKLDSKEVDVSSQKIVNLANGVADNDAVNVSQLNASVASLNAADSALDARLDIAEGDIVSLKGRMSTAESNISTLQSDLAAEVLRATGAETTLQSNINAEQSARIAADSALDARMTTAEGDIVSLEGRMDTAESDIAALESSVLYVSKFVTRETPAGAVDASNVEFVLANAIVLGSEQVFLNGLLQEPGIGNDYLISGSTITFNNAPQVNDRIRVSYLKA